jgi:hypothetical protein
VGVDLGLTLGLHPRALRTAVRQGLRAAVLGGVFAHGSLGFGEEVWLSRLVAAAAAVEGVAWVRPDRFARWNPYGDAAGIPDGLAMAALEVAVLKDDPAQPWNGSLALALQGGLG